MRDESSNYQDFFREEIYDKFVKFLLGKFSSATCIALLADEPLFTKKGVHVQFRKLFNEFLNQNPRVEKVYVQNSCKTFVLKNISGEMLHFPVDSNDDDLMVREAIRIPVILPLLDLTDIPRARKNIKNTSERMKNQILKGDWKDKTFVHPMNLTLHFKRGYALAIKKTTQTFRVSSKEQINSILFDMFENKVAYAIFDNERLTFVRNGNPTKKKSVHNQI